MIQDHWSSGFYFLLLNCKCGWTNFECSYFKTFGYLETALLDWYLNFIIEFLFQFLGERGGSVVECRTPEREVRGSRPTAAVLCPWARHFTPRKYWLITQEAMAPSRYDWKIVDWDVKPQHNQPNLSVPVYTHQFFMVFHIFKSCNSYTKMPGP